MGLAQVLDLFVEGQAASVETPGGETFTVWVNKLSPFEKEDADRFGRSARAKRVLSWDASEDEQALFEIETDTYSDEDVAAALAGQVAGKHYFDAVNEIRTEKEWDERLEYLAQADVLAVTSDDASAEDKALFEKISTEYADEIAKRQAVLNEAYIAEQLTRGRADMLVDYRKAWRDADGMRAFYAERHVAEVYFATRECAAKVGKDGSFDHTKCKSHRQRFFTDRGQVKECPEALLVRITETIQAIDMTPAEAGNSDAPTASSEPSEQPSTAEDSTPSTPTATSDEPAGT